MKYFIAGLSFALLFCFTGCEEKCIEHEYYSKVVVDVSDSSITSLCIKDEVPMLSRITPENLGRCERTTIGISAIGASIENEDTSISFPEKGFLPENIGNYGLADSNKVKSASLQKGFERAIHGFIAIGNNYSQIFYTIDKILRDTANNGRVIVYTDLIEFHDSVSFYKPVFNIENMIATLMKQYSIDSTKISFKGKLSLISPFGKNQDKVLYARSFYKRYFQKMGVSANQYEFLGSISQTKF